MPGSTSWSKGLGACVREGLPIVGVTWWPFIDFVDWSWASGGSVVEEFYRRDGEGQQPHPVAPLGVPVGRWRRSCAVWGCTAWRPTPRATSSDDRPGCWPVSGHVLYRPRRARSFRAAGLLANKGAIMPGKSCHCAEVPRRRQDSVRGAARSLPLGPGSLLLGSGPTQFAARTGPSTSRGRRVTPGHEAAGVVVAAGPETSVAEGTPGVVFLMDYCGRCRSCRLGFTNQCLAKRADMGFTHDGGYGPYEVVHESNFFAVDAGTDLVEATMLLDVMGTSSHAIARARLGAPRHRVCLYRRCRAHRRSAARDVQVDLRPRVPGLHKRHLALAAQLRRSRSARTRSTPPSPTPWPPGAQRRGLRLDGAGRRRRQGALAALSKRGVLVCVGHGETLELVGLGRAHRSRTGCARQRVLPLRRDGAQPRTVAGEPSTL